MEELFKSDLDASSTGLNSGGDIGSNSSEPGGCDWTNPQQSGLDGDLQRSQEAVALNELLQEQGLEGGAVDALVQGDSYGDLGGASDDPLLSEVAPPPLALSLVVLDQSLDDWRELAVSAPADAELLVLDQASDGVAQISDYLLQQRLDGQGSYSSLEIVSEGADGLLQLGNGTLEAANLSSYGDQLRTWADSLTSGADLLLFGSNVAASAAGVSFVQELASLTGTNVAASRDRTGATEQGGNLLLEEQTGLVETSLAWLEQSIDELGMVLDAPAMEEEQEAASSAEPVAEQIAEPGAEAPAEATAEIALEIGSEFSSEEQVGSAELAQEDAVVAVTTPTQHSTSPPFAKSALAMLRP
ncbi:DUF4347 domain-containing protein [Synechococcus sp. CBW1108]|uniref:DUF4347 domain-containing protein n=1 Tax=Synechococcus sp. CBW1108 TaxID=1353147 RepID=UPI0018CD432C|nr:DUF4347 domain-containing protein [Synechococcus sp. CBW1108]QPN69362.1 DUF4347 domain-containing protein [Synechococcus sp. CBW1108]